MFALTLLVIASAIIGAVVASIVVASLYAILEPSSFRDGQFVLAYILSIPVGFLLGGAIGYVKLKQGKPRASKGRVLTIAGTLGVILILCVCLLSASSRGLSLQGVLATIISPWSLGPFILSLAVLIRGVVLTQKITVDNGS
jgi:hypothetical protein